MTYDPMQPHRAFATGPAARSVAVELPPVAPWSGASERFIAAPDNPWVTRAEASGFSETPDFAETREWLERLAAAWPDLTIGTLGKTAGGREIPLVIASRHGMTPDAVHRSGKAVIYVQAGIHSGEVDGKDAMLMLLRDMAFGDLSHLLDEAVILFTPVLNRDGYDRQGAFNRVNMRGPTVTGWHTNDWNLNLNRDFAKLDAPETRAVIRLFREWQPDLFIDTHVTDGADYQYDVTFGQTSGLHGWSPRIAEWIESVLTPQANADLTREGHVPGPLTLAANDRDMSEGRLIFTANARFSTGGADLHHVPSILVENHSLKTVRQRVLGMYVLLQSLITHCARQVGELRAAISADRESRRAEIPLGWTVAPGPYETAPFKGIRSELYLCPVSGLPVPRWTGEPDDSPVAMIPMKKPVATAKRAAAYYIPGWLGEIVARLDHHGITREVLDAEVTVTATQLRLPDASLNGPNGQPQLSEGHVRVFAGEPVAETVTLTLPPGTIRVPTDQPLGDLVAVLLEPASPDSFFQWGFLPQILDDATYMEPYVVAPLAEKMLAADPDLRAAFESKLLNEPDFAADPGRRLTWFFDQTPYRDPRYRVYPILREEN